MRRTDAPKLALALPGTHEEPHFEMRSFRVGKKIFATLPPGGSHLHVFVTADVVRAAVQSDPLAFAELIWGRQLAGVRVDLARAERNAVRALLESAWRRRATKALLEAHDAAGRTRD